MTVERLDALRSRIMGSFSREHATTLSSACSARSDSIQIQLTSGIPIVSARAADRQHWHMRITYDVLVRNRIELRVYRNDDDPL